MNVVKITLYCLCVDKIKFNFEIPKSLFQILEHNSRICRYEKCGGHRILLKREMGFNCHPYLLFCLRIFFQLKVSVILFKQRFAFAL